MSSAKKTFLILDGNALLHRAWHAVPPLTTKDGRVVNAAYGFTNVVEKMLSLYKPDFMAVAWDLPGGTFRHEEFAEYKATREKKADELYAQIPIIQMIMDAYGIPSLSVPGFEADDILGTVSRMNGKKGYETLIVTGDLDSLQLVNADTKVVFFVKGLSEVKIYDEAAVKERYKLEPKRLIDLKTLVGDTSDNLPGVAGIGEKGAQKLLQKYTDIDGILEAMRDNLLPDKYVKKFKGQEKTVEQMRRLVTIVCDVPLKEFSYDTAEMKKPDPAKLLPMFEDLEFKTLIKKYKETKFEAATQAEPSPGSLHDAGDARPAATKKSKPAQFAQADRLEDLATDRIGLLVVKKAKDLFGASIASVALTDGERYFLVENPGEKDLMKVVEVIKVGKAIVAHDVKAIMHAFADAGVEIADAIADKPVLDTLLAAYMLNAGNRELDFGSVSAEILGARVEDSDVPAVCASLFPLADKLEAHMKRDKMFKLYQEVEMPLVCVLYDMERAGIAVDQKKLQSLSKDFAETIEKLEKQIYKLAGREFNVNSPSQLAVILFEDLQLPTKGVKKTKTGFSTAAPELEKLWEAHEIIPLLHEYREVAKLKSTYADSLPGLVAQDGRIHTTYNQTVAATGRLSSVDPNLQNIPIRTELGREIRCAFVAKAGYELLSADYSQIELRLAADFAKDESFIRAFRDGADIHTRTAAEVWDVAEDKVTKNQRAAAKAVNFSILYGVGAHSLGRRTGMSYAEAKDFIERYFAVHPGIHAYIDAMKMQARTEGYVETIFGRRRYLPEINSGVPQLIASAERMAMNMPIQGTQADIIKMAMIKIAAWLKESKIRCQMLLQVHDELVFEVHPDDVVEAKKQIVDLMSGVVDLSVPLAVDVAVAKSWGEME